MEVQTSTLPEHMLGAGRLVRGIRKMREAGIGLKPQTKTMALRPMARFPRAGLLKQGEQEARMPEGANSREVAHPTRFLRK